MVEANIFSLTQLDCSACLDCDECRGIAGAARRQNGRQTKRRRYYIAPGNSNQTQADSAFNPTTR
jgi:hypothetical protein